MALDHMAVHSALTIEQQRRSIRRLNDNMVEIGDSLANEASDTQDLIQEFIRALKGKQKEVQQNIAEQNRLLDSSLFQPLLEPPPPPPLDEEVMASVVIEINDNVQQEIRAGRGGRGIFSCFPCPCRVCLQRRLCYFQIARQKRKNKHETSRPWNHLAGIRIDVEWAECTAEKYRYALE